MPSPPPWDSWSLDGEFFYSLCSWSLDNRGGLLTEILDKISDGLDGTRDIRAFIPDAPFPAKSLIEALVCLLRLGIVSSCI
jgi:hypothetical protein